MCALAISCHLNRSPGVLKNSPKGPGGNEEHEDTGTTVTTYTSASSWRPDAETDTGNAVSARLMKSVSCLWEFHPMASLYNSTHATAVNVAQREPMSSVPGADHVDPVVLDLGRGPHRRGS